MKKSISSLGKQTVIYGLGDTLYRAVAFFLLPVYLRYLTTADYGTIETLMVTRGITVTLVVMGLPGAIFRFYYRANGDVEKKQVVSTIFFLSLIPQVFLPLLFWWQNEFISSLLIKHAELGFFVSILAVNIFLVSFRRIPLALLRAKEKAWAYTFVNLAVSTVTLLANIYFVVFLQKGVLGVLFGNLCGGAVGIAILLPSILREVGFVFDYSLIKGILSFSVPLGLALLPLTIIFMADRYFIVQLVGLDGVGIYALAYKLSSSIKMFIVMPFTLAYSPFIFSVENDRNSKILYEKSFTYFTVIGLAAVVFVSIISTDVIYLISSNKEFYSASNLVPVLSYAFFFFGVANIMNTGIKLSGKTYISMIIVSSCSVMNIIFNYIFIKWIGVYGAAFSLLVTFIILSFAQAYISIKIYPINYKVSKFLLLLAVSVMAIYLSTFLVHIFYKLFIMLSFLLFTYIGPSLDDEDKKKIAIFVKSSVLRRKN